MKNADMPAMPVNAMGESSAAAAQRLAIGVGYSLGQSEPKTGLTKREDFTKAAMQGLLSSMNLAEIHSASTHDVHAIINLSLLMADSALEALDKPVK